jgi:superfamily II DNA/RNA helicase
MTPSATSEPKRAVSADGTGKTFADLDTFASLGIDQWLVSALEAVSIEIPTEVQRRVIPELLQGKQVLASAQTGSGKTAAFALPLLQQLAADAYGVFAIVLEPTRELAVQVADQFKAFGAPIGLRVLTAVGGLNATAQAQALRKRPHIVVATPGRLAALLSQDSDARCVRRAAALVLDEADRLLTECFLPDLARIVARLPPASKRQTVLITATAAAIPEDTEAINSLAGIELLASSSPSAGAPEAEHSAAAHSTAAHSTAAHSAAAHSTAALSVVHCADSTTKTASGLCQQYVISPSAAKMAVLEQILLQLGPTPEANTPAAKALAESQEAAAAASKLREKRLGKEAAAALSRPAVVAPAAAAAAAAAAATADEELDSDDELDSDSEDADHEGAVFGPVDAGSDDNGSSSSSDEDEEDDEDEDAVEDSDAAVAGAAASASDGDGHTKLASGGLAESAAEAASEEEVIVKATACIIFCGTIKDCQLVAETLRELGWLTDALHSGAGQPKRLAALAKFRSGLIPILVATDVAARGLDIPEVGLVVNFDVPRVAEDYVHRVGRTARAQRGGRAVTIVTERDVELLHACESYAQVRLAAADTVSLDAAHKRLNRVATAVTVARLRLVESGLEERVVQEQGRRQEARRARQ